MERDVEKPLGVWDFEDFNSHAHVERDRINSVKLNRLAISTHTLTWSVTYKIVTIYRSSVISTHTLTWSVTALNGNYGGYPNISTHTLTWSVTRYFIMIKRYIIISTHTLTWSVTQRLLK